MRDHCHCVDLVWGVTCDAFNTRFIVHNTDTTFNNGELGAVVVPNVGETSDDTTWTILMGAAKTPAWYPYGCDTNPPVSSADFDESDPRYWKADLGTAAEKFVFTPPESEELTDYDNFRAVTSSRNIFIDYEARYVTYAVTPAYDADVDTGRHEPTFTTKSFIKDHVQINIADPTDATTYLAQWRGLTNPSLHPELSPNMDVSWTLYTDWYAGATLDSYEPYLYTIYLPFQATYYGKDFYALSSFVPDPFRRVGDDYFWRIGILKYEDLSVWCNNGGGPTFGTGNQYALGDYHIVCFSRQAFLLTEPPEPPEGDFPTLESRLPDEPWALGRSPAKNKLVAGIPRNGLLRDFTTGEYTSDTDVGLADGCLQNAEVANILVDGDNPPEDFPTEPFTNIQPYDYVHEFGKDYALFITDPHGDDPLQSPVADFEPEINRRRVASDTQLEDGAGGVPTDLGAVLDLVETPGTPISIASGDTTSGTFVLAKRFTLTVGETLYNEEANYPVSVAVPSVTGTLEWRFRLTRQNSSGVQQTTSDYSDTFTEEGTHSTTIVWNAGTWGVNDRITLDIEFRKVSGVGPVSLDEIAVNNSALTYVDLPLIAGGSLNHGLPTGMSFESRSPISTDEWSSENDGYFNNPPDYTNLNPTRWAAKAHSSPLFLGQVDLVIERVQVVDASSISFDIRLENSALTEGTFGDPTNIPADDGLGNHDTLELAIDGIVRWSTDNTGELAVAATFKEFRPITVGDGVTAGPHTFRWTLRRFTTLNTLAAWVDNIQFPLCLIKPDFNGVERWLYDGIKVRKPAKYEWPQRDEETDPPTPLYSRASTIPTGIAYDWRRKRLYYGNPHYLICERMDEGHEGELDLDFAVNGVLKWTASPSIPPPTSYVDEDCHTITGLNSYYDPVVDAPWGRFKIIPTKYGIQLRGVNGTWRDATHNPIPTDLFKDEKFLRILNAGSPLFHFGTRAHCWSISPDGETRIPHIEGLFRANFSEPSYPVAPPYTNADDPERPGETLPGPWPPWMEYDSPDLPPTYPQTGDPNFARIRDPRNLPEGSLKPQVNMLNKLIPRTYCDGSSRVPQFIHVHNPNPDPTEPGESGWEPGPWPSAQYKILPAYHLPFSLGTNFVPLYFSTTTCPVGDDFHYVRDTSTPAIGPWDFDAVDDAKSDCNCNQPVQDTNTSA